MRQALYALFMLPVAAICIAPAIAQQPLTDKDKAVLAFDIYIDRLTGSETAKASGLDDPAKALPMGEQDFDPKDIRRVFGAFSAPANVQAMETMQNGGDLPMNFFLRVQFKTPAAAEKAFAGMKETGQEETIGGKSYLRPPADDETAPKNMLAYMYAADTMEMGTDGFILQPDRHLFTENLSAAWKKMPVAAIRIAADLEGANHLIQEGLQAAQAGGGIPPQALPAMAVVENTGGIRFALDFSSENLLWLTLTGKDADGTNTIKGTLDGLLAMGKGFGQQGVAAIPDPNMQKVATELLAALSTVKDGNDVNLVLPRPDGFEEAIAGIVPMAMGAMMGGPGGPGGPGGDPFGEGPIEIEAAPAADPFGGDPFGN